MKPQTTLFTSTTCFYCRVETEGKPGALYPGFFDAETGHTVCNGCKEKHYRAKQAMRLGNISEMPIQHGNHAMYEGKKLKAEKKLKKKLATAAESVHTGDIEQLPARVEESGRPQAETTDIELPLATIEKFQGHSSIEAYTRGKAKKVFRKYGRTFTISGSGTIRATGAFNVHAEIVVPLSEYSGTLPPLPYAQHFNDVDLGNRKRCYVGMMFEAEGKKWVVIGTFKFHTPTENPIQEVEATTARPSEPQPDITRPIPTALDVIPDPGRPHTTAPKFYPGNKGSDGVFQRIINQMPPHTTYIELFAGSGQILIKKRPAARNIAIELNEETIATYSTTWPQSTEVICTDGIQWLHDNLDRFSPETLIYADPPYVMSTRRSQRALYECEMTDEQHRQLVGLLLAARCRVIVSNYPNAIYEELSNRSAKLPASAPWRKVTFTATTRRGNSTEVLWMNYPEPTELHQYDMLGNGKEHRRLIRRKVERHVAGLLRLPALERNAIINAIQTRVK